MANLTLSNGLKLIDIGLSPNSNTGDTLRQLSEKINANAQITLTINDTLAGTGLEWNPVSRQLSLANLAPNKLRIGAQEVTLNLTEFEVQAGQLNLKAIPGSKLSGSLSSNRLALSNLHTYIGSASDVATEVELDPTYFEVAGGQLKIAAIPYSDLTNVNIPASHLSLGINKIYIGNSLGRAAEYTLSPDFTLSGNTIALTASREFVTLPTIQAQGAPAVEKVLGVRPQVGNPTVLELAWVPPDDIAVGVIDAQVTASVNKGSRLKLFVNANHPAATDAASNKGLSSAKPFKTIERALLQAAAMSAGSSAGGTDDRYGEVSIHIAPGEYIVENNPGSSVEDAVLTVTTPNREAQLNTNSGAYYLYNPSGTELAYNGVDTTSVYGGVIIPRGVSLVGDDMRKVVIRPAYVHATNRSTIFRLSAGASVSGVTFRDKVGSTDSHHLLACVNLVSPGELALYYKKIARVFKNLTSIQDWVVGVDLPAGAAAMVNPDPATILQAKSEETDIEGAIGAIDSVSSAPPLVTNCSIRSVLGLSGVDADGRLVGGTQTVWASNLTAVSLQTLSAAFNNPANHPADAVAKSYKDSYKHFGFKASAGAVLHVANSVSIGFAQHYLADAGEVLVRASHAGYGEVAAYAKGYRTTAADPDEGWQTAYFIPPLPLSDSTRIKNTDISTGLTLDSAATQTAIGLGYTNRLYIKESFTSTRSYNPKTIGDYSYGWRNNANASRVVLEFASLSGVVTGDTLTQGSTSGTVVSVSGARATVNVTAGEFTLSAVSKGATNLGTPTTIYGLVENWTTHVSADGLVGKVFLPNKLNAGLVYEAVLEVEEIKASSIYNYQPTGIITPKIRKHTEANASLLGKFYVEVNYTSIPTYLQIRNNLAQAIVDGFDLRIGRYRDIRTEAQKIYRLAVYQQNYAANGKRPPATGTVIQTFNNRLINSGGLIVKDVVPAGKDTFVLTCVQADDNEVYQQRGLLPKGLIDLPIVETTNIIDPSLDDYNLTKAALATLANDLLIVLSLDPSENVISITGSNVRTVDFRRPATVQCVGQTWEWVGYLNYSQGDPALQTKTLPLVTAQQRLAVSVMGGAAYVSGLDQDGNYRTGNRLFDSRSGKELTLTPENQSILQQQVSGGLTGINTALATIENKISALKPATTVSYEGVVVGNENEGGAEPGLTIKESPRTSSSDLGSYSALTFEGNYVRLNFKGSGGGVINDLPEGLKASSAPGVEGYGFARKRPLGSPVEEEADDSGFITARDLKTWRVRRLLGGSANTTQFVYISPYATTDPARRLQDTNLKWLQETNWGISPLDLAFASDKDLVKKPDTNSLWDNLSKGTVLTYAQVKQWNSTNPSYSLQPQDPNRPGFIILSSLADAAAWCNDNLASTDTATLVLAPGYYYLDATFNCAIKINGAWNEGLIGRYDGAIPGGINTLIFNGNITNVAPGDVLTQNTASFIASAVEYDSVANKTYIRIKNNTSALTIQSVSKGATVIGVPSLPALTVATDSVFLFQRVDPIYNNILAVTQVNGVGPQGTLEIKNATNLSEIRNVHFLGAMESLIRSADANAVSLGLTLRTLNAGTKVTTLTHVHRWGMEQLIAASPSSYDAVNTTNFPTTGSISYQGTSRSDRIRLINTKALFKGCVFAPISPAFTNTYSYSPRGETPQFCYIRCISSLIHLAGNSIRGNERFELPSEVNFQIGATTVNYTMLLDVANGNGSKFENYQKEVSTTPGVYSNWSVQGAGNNWVAYGHSTNFLVFGGDCIFDMGEILDRDNFIPRSHPFATFVDPGDSLTKTNAFVRNHDANNLILERNNAGLYGGNDASWADQLVTSAATNANNFANASKTYDQAYYKAASVASSTGTVSTTGNANHLVDWSTRGPMVSYLVGISPYAHLDQGETTRVSFAGFATYGTDYDLNTQQISWTSSVEQSLALKYAGIKGLFGNLPIISNHAPATSNSYYSATSPRRCAGLVLLASRAGTAVIDTSDPTPQFSEGIGLGIQLKGNSAVIPAAALPPAGNLTSNFTDNVYNIARTKNNLHSIQWSAGTYMTPVVGAAASLGFADNFVNNVPNYLTQDKTGSNAATVNGLVVLETVVL